MRTDFRKEMYDQFGHFHVDQLWLLTKFAKNVRLRCRNNSAFNNFMNVTFDYAKFDQVQKQHADGSYYPGLRITVNGGMREEEDETGVEK
jgi:hypothetical protein